MLVVLGGLPGVGKTTIAIALAKATGAVHVRIDSIEEALRRAGQTVEGEGYAVAYAVAADNLRVGRVVIADCVNPWPLTREAWRGVAQQAGVRAVEVEVVCSDDGEHRRRVEARCAADPAAGHPTWPDVANRDYRRRDDDRLVVDTSTRSIAECVRAIVAALPAP